VGDDGPSLTPTTKTGSSSTGTSSFRTRGDARGTLRSTARNEATDLDQTAANKPDVRALVEDVLIPVGDPHNVDRYISSFQHIQHNRDVPDHLDPFKPLAIAEDKSLVYDEIVLLVSQGNFVATLCRARWEGAPYAQADLFRLNDGLILEHWMRLRLSDLDRVGQLREVLRHVDQPVVRAP
jgi:predicted SnoaL-like aldol condensation-catalyzing enzyme